MKQSPPSLSGATVVLMPKSAVLSIDFTAIYYHVAYMTYVKHAQQIGLHQHAVRVADEGNGGEDEEAEPYNKRDKDEVPSKALTGDSRPSDMEDAWGHDPRWQVGSPLLFMHTHAAIWTHSPVTTRINTLCML